MHALINNTLLSTERGLLSGCGTERFHPSSIDVQDGKHWLPPFLSLPIPKHFTETEQPSADISSTPGRFMSPAGYHQESYTAAQKGKFWQLIMRW